MSYSKNFICKFMQATSWYDKLFHFHLSFLIWKCGKGKKQQKSEHLENEQSFFDETKTFYFTKYFWKAIIWWKKKWNFDTNSGHKLQVFLKLLTRKELLKCIKGSVSENLSAVNVLNIFLLWAKWARKSHF